jgi:hypothetical protein
MSFKNDSNLTILPLEFSEELTLIGIIVGVAIFFTKLGIDVRSLRRDSRNQAEALKAIMTYMAETMDKQKALDFIKEVFVRRGRW